MITRSERLDKLPPYLFHEIDLQKQKEIKNGADLVDLGIGDPDLPTPDPIIESLYAHAKNPANHRYPSQLGLEDFRRAAADWIQHRFNLTFDSQKEILTLIGTKEGIGHLPLAVLNPGDVALIPNPGYPVYRSGVIFAGATPVELPLLQENEFLPDLYEVDEDILRKTRLMFINYPNNPTNAIADLEFFEEIVDYALKYDFLICHDASYSEITYDDYTAPSIFQVDGAKDVAIEMHSLSKTFNMTGWRIGFAVGNQNAIAALTTLKNNLDSGVFNPIQYAAIKAFDLPQKYIRKTIEEYEQRRDILCNALSETNLEYRKPKATFYIWISVPEEHHSMSFTSYLLRELGIVATPGVGFGKYGEHYIRFSLTAPTVRIREAVKRIKQKL